MLLYQSFLANQKDQNCCWLYAPALAQCSMPFKEDFKNQVEYFEETLKTKGHSGPTIAGWRTNGILPGSAVIAEMGLKKIGDLADYAMNSFGAPDHTQTYWKLNDLLLAEGPVVLQYAALGSGSTHQSAITGLIFGKESSQDADEVHLITPHTQHVRLTVLPVFEVLKHSQDRHVPVEIFRVPERSGKPLRPDLGLVWTSSGLSHFFKEELVQARSFSLSTAFNL